VVLPPSEHLKSRLGFFGSAQEFDKARILGRFLKNDKFCFCDRHALGLKQQVGEILLCQETESTVS
jgi:hypothetical protein